MTPTIREYRAEDFSSCRQLWAELVEWHRRIYDDPGIGGPDPGRHFDAHLSDPHRRITWVGEIAGTVVGMASLLVGGEEAEIEPVVVAEGFRGQGVGRALVVEATSHARSIGVKFLSVKPVARNVEALAFFAGCGFQTVGQVELFQDLKPPQGRKWQPGLSIRALDLSC